ncbi:Adenylate and Guanylate cyclase catalytic domain containing protein [Trichomonas vaginalis G3]|uniref:Adenylate and Guanylate cyclase catalytic domain containing protein n=1 Tax=Trichomonas vaginalis (strain ATCC PRA-98 / G3) TaxID=412133 RepID=A2G1D8_TRIV3|nr:guanylate cyclase protein [Trichomonas vaginalis G3]EAX89018.1 Adenylate and Guanylate cyclase catalytic domain containing protein [Trichomonas vaginalis G3]KAI5552911.1 guanylate cyclase protein [Trichomonas vaginalis G3]|eukprot:XP_001301948.1 Adenylate and Guanylate cyclase catalytic domain containing protein [Trichomonas vaginalis G3]
MVIFTSHGTTPKWPDDLAMWAIYAKFAAVYPEQSNCMSFIANNMRNCKADKDLIDQKILNIGQIIKTRETLFTVELKSRIAKLTKHFDKSINRLRNIWDLVLQGNFGEMDHSNKSAYLSVNESEVEVNQLMMLYPNNRFVARQYFRFLSEIKLDYVNARIWKENYRLLQSGIQVNKDTLHDLGMIAFPNIPENIVNSFSSKILITTNDEEIFQSEENIMADDDLDNQQPDTIKKLIDNHKVPALQFMKFFMIINLIVFILIPFLALYFYFGYFTDSLDEPLDYLYGISSMRNLINILPLFIGKYLLEELPDPKNPSQTLMEKNVITEGFPLNAYGGYLESKEATEYLIAQVPLTTALLTSLRSYKVGNEIIEEVRTKIFSSVLPFNIYESPEEVMQTKTSMIELIVLIATHCAKVLDFEKVDVSVAGGLDAVTSRSNDVTTTRVAGEAMSLLVDYIREVNDKNQKIFTGIMLGMIILCVISFFVLYHLQLKQLKMNKEELYSVFSSLPKTVISNVSASFSNSKQDSMSSKTNETESNRQEDGIIKMFSSINDGTAGSIEIYNAFNVLIVGICACVEYFLMLSSYKKASETLVKNCHHVNYIYGSICQMFSLVSSMITILPAKYDDSLYTLCPRPDVEMNVIRNFVPTIVDYLNLLRLGGKDEYDIPFLGMKKALQDSTEILHKNVDQNSVPKTIPESAHQFSCELQIYLTIALLKKQVNLMTQDIWPKLRDEGIEDLWQIGPFELYETFYSHTGRQLVPTIQGQTSKEEKPILICCISFTLVSLLFTIVSLIMIHNESKLLRFALLNLLRVQPTILFQNSRIMDVLSGNYSKRKDDEIERDLKFHNEVANKLNDIVVVVNEENNKILSANKAFEDTFRIKEEDIIDTLITDFFVNERFSCDGKVEKALNTTTVLTFIDHEENKNFIEFSTQSVAGRKIFSGRNITQTLMHEKMIDDEKKRSDQMLASILPACLVPRVQAEEKNISFAIKSVTVLFLDVVEFTPWCGSHDAQYVMRMLNIMFKEYDLLTNAHKTMTKIKCIGDCYMAAGGIFDEVNQPAVHAKEVVDFGCSVIKKLVEIDERENESLRIRVGINTGGPIIAGVIGTEKPTFEIFGPAINIAHEMESKGVPMKVHVSRPVYELIYGQQFVIKERGEIDIKGGKMFTYLVDP